MDEKISSWIRLSRIIYWYIMTTIGGLFFALIIFLGVKEQVSPGIVMGISLLLIGIFALMSFVGYKFVCKWLEYRFSSPEVKDSYPQTESEKRVITLLWVILIPVNLVPWVGLWFVYRGLGEELGIPMWVFFVSLGIFLSVLAIVFVALYRYRRSNRISDED